MGAHAAMISKSLSPGKILKLFAQFLIDGLVLLKRRQDGFGGGPLEVAAIGCSRPAIEDAAEQSWDEGG